MLNIVIPIAGEGKKFQEAGYSFPKPLIDIQGQTMIEVVVNNLRPKIPHQFIFVGLKKHFEDFDLYHILQNATQNQFEIIKLTGSTAGAACSVLSAIQYIDNNEPLLIANGDQYLAGGINDFLDFAHTGNKDGAIMTFTASHPRWSYARTDKQNRVIETAEKKVISKQATVGVYYFKHGQDFVAGTQNMITKNIRTNNEFYVCPVFNELILANKQIFTYPVEFQTMQGLGTPEDLQNFIAKVERGDVRI